MDQMTRESESDIRIGYLFFLLPDHHEGRKPSKIHIISRRASEGNHFQLFPSAFRSISLSLIHWNNSPPISVEISIASLATSLSTIMIKFLWSSNHLLLRRVLHLVSWISRLRDGVRKLGGKDRRKFTWWHWIEFQIHSTLACKRCSAVCVHIR